MRHCRMLLPHQPSLDTDEWMGSSWTIMDFNLGWIHRVCGNGIILKNDMRYDFAN